jgi:5'(3')-deoxyribonucleotidase
METTKRSETHIKPRVFLDMDGVLADFFGAWAQQLGGAPNSNWEYIKTIPQDRREQSVRKLSHNAEFVQQFFATLKPLDGGKQILKLLTSLQQPYTILSAPLEGRNAEASIRGKKQWLSQHNLADVPAIFTRDKWLYATQPNGSPNLLIDDYGKNVTAWRNHGGIAVKHDDSTTNQTLKQLLDHLA